MKIRYDRYKANITAEEAAEESLKCSFVEVLKSNEPELVVETLQCLSNNMGPRATYVDVLSRLIAMANDKRSDPNDR